MEIRLTIEDAIECFGRAKIEQWINNGMQFEHKFQMRTMLGREVVRGLGFDERCELLKLNVRVGEPPKRKKIKAKNIEEAIRRLKEYTESWKI